MPADLALPTPTLIFQTKEVEGVTSRKLVAKATEKTKL